MRKPAFSICEKKGIYQLCGDRAADQCLFFSPHKLPKFKIPSLWPDDLLMLYIQKTGFLTKQLKYQMINTEYNC